jgi:hypothetical protein
MEKYIFILLVFLSVNVFAQIKSNGSISKIIRKTNETNLEIQKLDSLYLSALGNGISKCAFPNNQDSAMSCWSKFIENMDNTLKRNNFKWHSEPQLHIRSYFNENGYIDFFAYSIKDTTFTRYDEFEKALKEFVYNYNFGLTSDRKFAQCSTIKFGNNK